MTDRAETFDALYRSDPDPWSFLSSPYERGKAAAAMALLLPHYATGLEIGCSIGVMTEMLAARCGRFTAVDVSEVALSHARRRCAGREVAFVRANVPDEWPSGAADLIVISEVLYFLSRAEVLRCTALCLQTLRPGGDVLLVNWLGPTDTALTGDEAAAAFLASADLTVRAASRTERYRLDVLSRQ